MISPITLEGKYIRLEPLALHHAEGLFQAALHEDLWQTPWTIVPGPTLEHVHSYIERALSLKERGTEFPFAQIDIATNTIIGSTRFMNIALEHKRLEIGGTWIGKPWQRGVWNTEAKLLLLTHAFEVLQCNRVEWKTDVLNTQSRLNIERLGAQYEGVFRRHIIMPNGRVRDTVYYSMIQSEWAHVKEDLLFKLEDRYYNIAAERNVVRADMRYIDRLAELFDEYRQFYKQPSDIAGAKEFLTERLRRNESVIFLAVANDYGLGFTQLYPAFSSVSMQRLWILNDLFVSSRARKHHVGRTLMRAAEEFARNDGAKGLVLSTAVDNLPAQTLYEKQGWERDTEFYTYQRYF